jgi:hypothetical protein
MTVFIRPTRLHWIDAFPDWTGDLCAHSPVHVEANGAVLVKPEDGDCTVSASVIYLLRTLSQPHNVTSRVGEHLFPCCGHAMLDVGGPDVCIIGCPGGSDFAVERHQDVVTLSQPGGVVFEVSFREWRAAVCGFADTVRDFYERSPPRKPRDDTDANGFRVLRAEWARRREAADSLV